METEQQWCRLPADILRIILKRLNTNTRFDTLRVRSVCKSWRSSVPPFNQTLTLTPSLPLNLPFPIAPNPFLNPNRRGHFSLTQSTLYFVQPPPPSSFSSVPWLLRVEEEDHESGKCRPLNPLSKILTERVPKAFPKSIDPVEFQISEIGWAYSLQFVDRSKKKIETDFVELKSILVKKVVVSSMPWSGDDYAVVAIHGGKLGFIKTGDQKWSPIDDAKYDDVVYHKGKFYAVDYWGRAVVIGCDLKVKRVGSPFPGRSGGQSKHLVEVGDDGLYLIDKCLDADEEVMVFDESVNCYVLDERFDPETPVHLKVYKLNEEHKEWERVHDLNDRVFFIGDDCSYSVSAHHFPTLKGNCIYFSEDFFNGLNEEEQKLGEFCSDTGVCNLEDGRCGPLALFPDHWPIFWPPPTWLVKPKPRASTK